MAMIKCKECGSDISNKADACPKCGAKPKKTSLLVKIILGSIVFSALISISRQEKPANTSSAQGSLQPAPAPAPTRPIVKIDQEAAAKFPELNARRADAVSVMKNFIRDNNFPEAEQVGEEFALLNDQEINDLTTTAKSEMAKANLPSDAEKRRQLAEAKINKLRDEIYFTEKDEMTGKTIKRAIFKSSNSVEFSFPYQGGTSASLEFRNHPRYGKDVVFFAKPAQLLCHSYSSCDLTIRIDENPPFRAKGTGPADNSTTTIFLDWTLVSKLKNASTVRIEVPTYQNGNPAFEFSLKGLEISRIN